MIILLLALLFLGPKRLPDIASTLGKAIRSFRKATSDLQDQLDVDDSVKAPFRELKAALRDDPVPAQAAQLPVPPAHKPIELAKPDAKIDEPLPVADKPADTGAADVKKV